MKLKNCLPVDLIYNGNLWKSGEAIEVNPVDESGLLAEGHKEVEGEE